MLINATDNEPLLTPQEEEIEEVQEEKALEDTTTTPPDEELDGLSYWRLVTKDVDVIMSPTYGKLDYSDEPNPSPVDITITKDPEDAKPISLGDIVLARIKSGDSKKPVNLSNWRTAATVKTISIPVIKEGSRVELDLVSDVIELNTESTVGIYRLELHTNSPFIARIEVSPTMGAAIFADTLSAVYDSTVELGQDQLYTYSDTLELDIYITDVIATSAGQFGKIIVDSIYETLDRTCIINLADTSTVYQERVNPPSGSIPALFLDNRYSETYVDMRCSRSLVTSFIPDIPNITAEKPVPVFKDGSYKYHTIDLVNSSSQPSIYYPIDLTNQFYISPVGFENSMEYYVFVKGEAPEILGLPEEIYLSHEAATDGVIEFTANYPEGIVGVGSIIEANIDYETDYGITDPAEEYVPFSVSVTSSGETGNYSFTLTITPESSKITPGTIKLGTLVVNASFTTEEFLSESARQAIEDNGYDPSTLNQDEIAGRVQYNIPIYQHGSDVDVVSIDPIETYEEYIDCAGEVRSYEINSEQPAFSYTLENLVGCKVIKQEQDRFTIEYEPREKDIYTDPYSVSSYLDHPYTVLSEDRTLEFTPIVKVGEQTVYDTPVITDQSGIIYGMIAGVRPSSIEDHDFEKLYIGDHPEINIIRTTVSAKTTEVELYAGIYSIVETIETSDEYYQGHSYHNLSPSDVIPLDDNCWTKEGEPGAKFDWEPSKFKPNVVLLIPQNTTTKERITRFKLGSTYGDSENWAILEITQTSYPGSFRFTEDQDKILYFKSNGIYNNTTGPSGYVYFETDIPKEEIFITASGSASVDKENLVFEEISINGSYTKYRAFIKLTPNRSTHKLEDSSLLFGRWVFNSEPLIGATRQIVQGYCAILMYPPSMSGPGKTAGLPDTFDTLNNRIIVPSRSSLSGQRQLFHLVMERAEPIGDGNWDLSTFNLKNALSVDSIWTVENTSVEVPISNVFSFPKSLIYTEDTSAENEYIPFLENLYTTKANYIKEQVDFRVEAIISIEYPDNVQEKVTNYTYTIHFRKRAATEVTVRVIPEEDYEEQWIESDTTFMAPSDGAEYKLIVNAFDQSGEYSALEQSINASWITLVSADSDEYIYRVGPGENRVGTIKFFNTNEGVEKFITIRQ